MMKQTNIALLGLLFLTLTSFTYFNHLNHNFVITHGQAGPFTLNSAFPGEGSYLGYDLVKKEAIHHAEDGTDKEIVYHAQKEGITHIIIHPKPDNDALIGELEVVSSLYETEEGIGVGSSLNDFYSYYPKAEAFYTFVSGMYWLEQPDLKETQFMIDEETYLGEPDDSSDLTELKKSKLDMKGRITSIRIY